MKKLGRGSMAIGVVAAAMLSACATTQVTGSWRDPKAEPQGPGRTLVVGVVPNETGRRSLEDSLAMDLAREGVQAVPSNRLLESADKLDAQSLEEMAHAQGFDSVLISRFRGVRTEFDYSPGWGYAGYWGWGGWWTYPYDGYAYAEQYALLETSLFENVDGGKMIWSATTQTRDPARIEGRSEGIAQRIVDRMKKDHIF